MLGLWHAIRLNILCKQDVIDLVANIHVSLAQQFLVLRWNDEFHLIERTEELMFRYFARSNMGVAVCRTSLVKLLEIIVH